MSGQREEEPLELGLVGLGRAVLAGGALLQAGRDDLETGPVSARDAAASRVTALVADLSSKRNRQGGTSRSFRLLVLMTFRYRPRQASA